MPFSVPVGIDDFRTLRELGLAYVDKSRLIRDLIDDRGAQVVLLPRPRRFGKTLNLSMLRAFFEKREEDLSHLFEGLDVWESGPDYRAHFQRYPTLHLTFKGTRFERPEECWGAIKLKVERLFDAHRSLLTTGLLSDNEARDYRAVLDGTAAPPLFARSLLDLTTYLARLHGEKVILLIDEYDEPIHAGYMHGFLDRIVDPLRALLTEALKGNPHIEKAVLTGILRVAEENIFSGLNNVSVSTVLSHRHATSFGFTEPEVDTLLTRAARTEAAPAVRAWYNGYLFGGQVIYNPWSVMSFLHNPEDRPRPYWVATSSNDLVKKLLTLHAPRLEADFEALLTGDSIPRSLEEDVILTDLEDRPDALFSLLVFSGYLKAEEAKPDSAARPTHHLSIPNREVREVYTTTFRSFMELRMTAPGASLDRLVRSLLGGDAESFAEQLQAFATSLLSYHDAAGKDPERVYHAFVIGLLAVLEPDYLVRSNRESGAGRPDVLVTPRTPGKPAALLELKVARRGKRPPQAVLREALAQIRERDYPAELRAAGASEVHAFAVAFDGIRVRVRSSAGRPTRLRAAPTACGSAVG
ncbi:MAG: AAA family ATPase [Polyangiaceae bacterium]